MICPKCNTENLLGAIFCRSCGDKLDIDAVDSANFEEMTGVKSEKGLGIKKLLSTGLPILLVVGLAAIVFFGTRTPDYTKPTISDRSLNSCRKKIYQVSQGAAWFKRRDLKYQWKINQSELSSYVNHQVSELKKGPIEFNEINIELMSGNQAAARFIGSIKSVKLVFTARGGVSVSGGTVNFDLKSGSIGKLPLPAFLAKPIFKGMLSQTSADKATLSKVDTVSVTGGNLVLTVKGSKEYKRPRRR